MQNSAPALGTQEDGFRRRRGEGRSYGGGPSSISFGGGVPEERPKRVVPDEQHREQQEAVRVGASAQSPRQRFGSAGACHDSAAESQVAGKPGSPESAFGARLGRNLLRDRAGISASATVAAAGGGGSSATASVVAQVQGTQVNGRRPLTGAAASVPPPRLGRLGGDEVESEGPQDARVRRSPSPGNGGRRRGAGKSSGGGPTSICLGGGDGVVNGSRARENASQQSPAVASVAEETCMYNADGFDATRPPLPAMPQLQQPQLRRPQPPHQQGQQPQPQHQQSQLPQPQQQQCQQPLMQPHHGDPRHQHAAAAWQQPNFSPRCDTMQEMPSYEELASENQRLREELAQVQSELEVYRRWYDGLVGAGEGMSSPAM